MQWHQGDFIELAQQKEISIVVFSANYTVNRCRLVMGAGAALCVKKTFPSIDLALGTYIAYNREVKGLLGDYYVQAVSTINTRGFFGDERENPAITVVALQVKRSWRDYADWNLTVESLTHLRDYLEGLRVSGKAYQAVLNCPLIGLGGFSGKEKEVRAMVEEILKDTDVFVCTL